MSHPKRAWILVGSALGVLALVIAGLSIHAGSAAASANNNSPITYLANPPVRQMNKALMKSGHQLPTTAECIAAVGLACYTPAQIRTAYNIPASATGAGQTIVIVDAYGSPTIRTDLQIFDQEFGLSDPTLNIFYPTGKPATSTAHQGLPPNWSFETSLDVEWAHAIAPDATIDLVVASSPSGNVLNVAQSFAVSHHLGSVMSLSFGAPENAIKGGGNNLQLMQAHANYEAARAANITVFSSAGDNGATDGTSSISADYPSSDPLVTSVGGTNLFLNGDDTYNSETVWNDSDPSLCPFGCTQGQFGATGGAPSNIFSAPSYQSALSGNSARTTADVSYNASVYTAVWVYIGFFADPSQNGFYFVGGTSSGSPQWAAITADANAMAGHSLGFLNPKLYAIGANSAQYTADFHDVTVGQNGFNSTGFNAGTGYDIPTGLGTPNVANLFNDLTH